MYVYTPPGSAMNASDNSAMRALRSCMPPTRRSSLSPPCGGSSPARSRGITPSGQFEGLRRPPGADLASQVENLRKQGSRVEVITPDADSRAAMGANQMDPATRIPAARAGFAQGKQEATRVTFL
jgi:hypothetical protein